MNTNARPFSCWQPLLLCGLLYAGCHNGYHDEVIETILRYNTRRLIVPAPENTELTRD